MDKLKQILKFKRTHMQKSTEETLVYSTKDWAGVVALVKRQH